MTQHEDDNGIEIEGAAADVVAGKVTIHQGGARTVEAQEVQIRQGGAFRVTAEEVEVTQGGIAFASVGSAAVTGGGVGILTSSGPVELKAAAAQVVLARGEADMEQSAAGVVAGNSVQVTDSVVGVMVGSRIEARNVRVLFSVPAAAAFGAATGVVLWLLSRLKR